MDINSLFSNYLRAADLNGDERTVSITRVTLETMRDGKTGEDEQNAVVHFEELDKPMVLNRTNGRTIAELFGPETDSWRGKKVGLYVQRDVEAFGKRWDVVRVKQAPPTAADGGVDV